MIPHWLRLDHIFLILSVGLLLLCGVLLSGCQTVAMSGATGAGIAAVEERSIGTVVDDTTIYAEINHLFIQADVNDLLTNVDIRVNDGRVLLTGQVNHAQTPVEAVRLAWEARGVREVINEIKVNNESTIAEYAQDQWIETQIEARLLATKDIKSINYTVEVVGGVVYLLGIAQDAEELRNAAYIASITEGVQKVISYVRLKTDPGVRPQAL